VKRLTLTGLVGSVNFFFGNWNGEPEKVQPKAAGMHQIYFQNPYGI
jgi:hypothetical protein